MRGEIFDPLVGPGLFVGAVEIVERERDVFGQPRQQFDQLVGEYVFLLAKKQQHADRLAALFQQRKAGAGPGSAVPCASSCQWAVRWSARKSLMMQALPCGTPFRSIRGLRDGRR